MLNRMTIAILLITLIVTTRQAEAQSNKAQSKQRQTRKQDWMENAKAKVYKTVGNVHLKVYLFEPKGHQQSDKKPAIVFFFGGGWRAGSPSQFVKHCEYLASRGMVAAVADYRVASRHNVKAVSCVSDAKSAIRWIRQHAGKLGVDPKRIAAGGGSAGGHIAACTGTITRFDEPDEDRSVSSVPNAMVLFNPALVLTEIDGKAFLRNLDKLPDRTGVDPKAISPFDHITKGQPPTIIFHGKADTTVPYASAEAFVEAMKQVGNRCELVGYEDQPHGFFNFGRSGNKPFKDSVEKMDRFLISLGYLSGEPTVQEMFKQ